jgi:choline dehydrogenase-like flavoprotein
VRGEVIHASAASADLELDAQVCIVGSGAGGGVLAMRLAQAGVRVVMLEAGPYVLKDEFTLREEDAYPLLYQDHGTRVSGDGSVTVMQGRSVGGGTTVNWTTCYRTPEHVLDHWAKVHGIKGLSTKRLEPHFEAVEKRLNIHQWPEEMANANNKKLLEGARQLGWQVGATRRNVRGCVNSGYCGMGCPVDAKQSMLITTLADALDAGMILVADCPVERIETEGRRAVSVVARAQGRDDALPQGIKVRVRAELIVVSAGALNGPALLLRSGLNPDGAVGKRTFIHPVIALLGRYAEPVQGFYGAPQSVASHQFAKADAGEVGFFFEVAPVHPMLAASVLPSLGGEAQEVLSNLAHFGALIALHIDGFSPGDEGGTVSLRAGGLPKLNYPISKALSRAMKRSHKRLTELTFAAGAQWALSLHADTLRMDNAAQIARLDERSYGAFKHVIFSAHQMGGCAMGKVVDENFKLREMDNIFVVDGSVFPTSLGVNPSQTIYGLAHLAAESIAKKLGKTL